MDFLKECARRLDEGTPTEEVLTSMRERYTTPGCLKVKTCLVRQLCNPSKEYQHALTDALEKSSEETRVMIQRAVDTGKKYTGDEHVDKILRSLPPTLPKNVRELHINGDEWKACKNNARKARFEKNRHCVHVHGEALITLARQELHAAKNVPDLALAIMFVTGRRECEVLCGWSTLSRVEGAEYAAEFFGQAKCKEERPPYKIPLLARFEDVDVAWGRLRDLQCHAKLTRRQASRKYQSALCRKLSARNDAFSDVLHPHGLRGAYACMALCAFRWGKHSPAFVTMCILGHRDLDESLVYTTYKMDEDFANSINGTLGEGILTILPAPSHPMPLTR
jgi:hypothetical protein